MKMKSVFTISSAPALKVAKPSGFCRSVPRVAKSRRLSLPSRGLFLTLLVFCSVALTGCQTPHQFAMPDKSWKTHIGQLKYSDAKRTIIGDVVVQQRGAQDFQLDFQKAGGIPLLTLREDATTARAEGLFARGSWQGAPSSAPPHLRNWVALREAFQKPDSGATRKMDFPADEQHFVFQLNR